MSISLPLQLLWPPKRWFLCVLLGLQSLGVQAQNTTSLYTIGNSFSDHAIGISNVALSLQRPLDFGRHMIPGAGLSWIWNNPGSGIQQQGYYPQALPAKAWDFVTLQPWDETLGGAATAAGQFTNLIYTHHSQTRVLILATSSLGKLPISPPGAFAAGFNTENASNSGSKAFFHGVVDQLRTNFPERPIGLVPIQHVIAELDRRLGLGHSVPEVSSLADLLDASNHFNARGRYLATLTLFSTMFRVPPTGAMRQEFASGYSVSQAFAEYAWQLVWDVVSNEPYAIYEPGTGLPNAVISASPLRGLAPLTVQFTGAGSSDPDGSIVSWQWDLGDGTTANSTSTTRTFAAGVWPVTLTVTDNEGKIAQSRVFVEARTTATEPIALEAEYATIGSKWQLVESTFASLGRAVVINPIFNRTTTSPDPVDASDLVRFEFNVPTTGNYTLQARVSAPSAEDDSFFVRVNGGAWFNWNNIGNRSAGYVWAAFPNQLNLSTGPAVIEFSWRENGTVLDKIQLARNSTVPNGMGLPGMNVPFDDQPPTSPTGLTASDVCVNSATLSWNAATDNVGVVAYQVHRDGILAGTTNATSFNVTGLFPSGNYSFTVQARDAEGNLSSPSPPYIVQTPANRAPTAAISSSVSVGLAPLTVTFSGSNSTDPDPGDVVIGYEWNLGNGPEGESVVQLTRSFAQPGNYTVTLTVVDLFGAQATTSVAITVLAPTPQAQWRQEQFGTPVNSGQAADAADPDGDGLNNFLEYALGRHPLAPNSLPPMELDLAAGKLRFSRARADLDYLIEASTDLSTWTTHSFNPGTVGQQVEVSVPSLSPQRFFRLRVTTR